MRWLFLLLLVLNACYLVWNLQDVPVKAKEVAVSGYDRSVDKGIQLLSEADGKPVRPTPGNSRKCLFLGGYATPEALEPVAEQLRQAGIAFEAVSIQGAEGGEHWLRLAGAEPSRLADDLLRDIKHLKQQIILCEGIATPE